MLYRMVTLQMTSSDPNHPNFYVLCIPSYLWNARVLKICTGAPFHSAPVITGRCSQAVNTARVHG